MPYFLDVIFTIFSKESNCFSVFLIEIVNTFVHRNGKTIEFKLKRNPITACQKSPDKIIFSSFFQSQHSCFLYSLYDFKYINKVITSNIKSCTYTRKNKVKKCQGMFYLQIGLQQQQKSKINFGTSCQAFATPC